MMCSCAADISTASVNSTAGITISSPHCGVYALYGAAKVLGSDVDIAQLIKPKFISTSKGSTASDLKQAASALGLSATSFRRGTVNSLKHLVTPCILHWRKSEHIDYDHYVLYLGSREGAAIILDPPEGVQMMPWHEVLLHWDGVGIAISKETNAAPFSLPVTFRSLYLWHIAPFAFIPVLSLLRRRRLLCQQRTTGGSFVSIAARETLYIFCFAIISSLGLHSLAEDGFLVHGDIVRSVQVTNLERFIKRCGYDDVKCAINQGALLVDARHNSDFRRGHIASAINASPMLTEMECKELLGNSGLRSRIIVYCQSSRCAFDEKLARKLYGLGYTNIEIYEGGWEDWQAHWDECK